MDTPRWSARRSLTFLIAVCGLFWAGVAVVVMEILR